MLGGVYPGLYGVGAIFHPFPRPVAPCITSSITVRYVVSASAINCTTRAVTAGIRVRHFESTLSVVCRRVCAAVSVHQKITGTVAVRGPIEALALDVRQMPRMPLPPVTICGEISAQAKATSDGVTVRPVFSSVCAVVTVRCVIEATGAIKTCCTKEPAYHG